MKKHMKVPFQYIMLRLGAVNTSPAPVEKTHASASRQYGLITVVNLGRLCSIKNLDTRQL